MITRRHFGAGVVIGGLSTTVTTIVTNQTRVQKNSLMHVGGDYHSVLGDDITSKQNLEYNLRHGVKYLTAEMKIQSGKSWDLDELRRMRDNCDKYGVVLEALRMNSDYIKLPRGPERDHEIEIVADNIRKSAQIGVRIVTYHWELIPFRRNAQADGRGGTSYVCFKLEDDWKNLPTGAPSRVTQDDYWERITHFLERIIPVAKENGIVMACHPSDPPGLPLGYQGVDQWDAPQIFDALKRYEAIVDTPNNGFQLDLGTTGAGLRNPAVEIFPIVEYFSGRQKIHQIHMKAIRGGLNNYCEVFPDEGEVDFLKVMRILRDAQFSGSICPDHMPKHPDDPGGFQAYAFGYGYITALIQAVNSEA
ncbi:MAG TPA: mannonate dehydratase [Terriglobales bacterium]|nr:mannonate dehydratase [Terriglobales bacterium]